MEWISVTPLLLLAVVCVLLVYFLPAALAYLFGQTRRRLILILNVLIAWSGIGWALLLAWTIVIRLRAS